jgi:hypothetical protein
VLLLVLRPFHGRGREYVKIDELVLVDEGPLGISSPIMSSQGPARHPRLARECGRE